MKAFAVWLGVTLMAFGATAAGAHLMLSAQPYRVAFVVDSSFGMSAGWSRVADVMREAAQRPYTQYAVVTEKGVVHSWSARPDLRNTHPYAPRDLSRLKQLAAMAPLSEADDVVLITNAASGELADLPGWTMRRP